MRIGSKFLAALSTALASAFFAGKSSAAGAGGSVALQYYFAGATDLAANTNFGRAKAIFSIPPSKYFMDLVLDRWAGVFWNDFQFGPGGDAPALLHPMLHDLLRAESVGSFGGHDKNRLDFVLAARLDSKSADAWQKNLETALHGQGAPLTAEGFSGWRWARPGNDSFWLLRARDWTVAGRGDGLSAVRDAYLQHIQHDHRPEPAVKDRWLSVDIDWPLLAAWAPLSDCPCKLARTIVDVTAEKGRMRATAHIFYPEAVTWNSEPWRIPKALVSSPLTSFTALRDLGVFLKPNQTLLRLSGNPLNGQLFCWALREMVLQSFAAWPVADATNAARKLGVEAPAVFNPILRARDHTELNWVPKADRLVWAKLPFTSPTLQTARETNGDFLLAGLFPLEAKFVPAPDQLWRQFEDRNDLVYYDWEMTGLRLRQWRLLTELLPVFPAPTREDEVRRQTAARNAKLSALNRQPLTPLAVTETWLAELTPVLGNTVTEVNRVSPTEFTAARNSQFLFTGLELVMLSHWLADAPVGPIDDSLLPFAKMSGPGLPRRR